MTWPSDALAVSSGGAEDNARAVMLKLIAEAEATTTDDAALKVWRDKNAQLKNWPWAHAQFKKAVVAHRKALEGAAQ